MAWAPPEIDEKQGEWSPPELSSAPASPAWHPPEIDATPAWEPPEISAASKPLLAPGSLHDTVAAAPHPAGLSLQPGIKALNAAMSPQTAGTPTTPTVDTNPVASGVANAGVAIGQGGKKLGAGLVEPLVRTGAGEPIKDVFSPEGEAARMKSAQPFTEARRAAAQGEAEALGKLPASVGSVVSQAVPMGAMGIGQAIGGPLGTIAAGDVAGSEAYGRNFDALKAQGLSDTDAHDRAMKSAGIATGIGAAVAGTPLGRARGADAALHASGTMGGFDLAGQIADYYATGKPLNSEQFRNALALGPVFHYAIAGLGRIGKQILPASRQKLLQAKTPEDVQAILDEEKTLDQQEPKLTQQAQADQQARQAPPPDWIPPEIEAQQHAEKFQRESPNFDKAMEQNREQRDLAGENADAASRLPDLQEQQDIAAEHEEAARRAAAGEIPAPHVEPGDVQPATPRVQPPPEPIARADDARDVLDAFKRTSEPFSEEMQTRGENREADLCASRLQRERLSPENVPPSAEEIRPAIQRSNRDAVLSEALQPPRGEAGNSSSPAGFEWQQLPSQAEKRGGPGWQRERISLQNRAESARNAGRKPGIPTEKLEPFRGEPWADELLGQIKPTKTPSPAAQERATNKKQDMAALKRALIEKYGLEIADTGNEANKIIAFRDNRPELLLSDDEAVRLAHGDDSTFSADDVAESLRRMGHDKPDETIARLLKRGILKPSEAANATQEGNRQQDISGEPLATGGGGSAVADRAQGGNGPAAEVPTSDTGVFGQTIFRPATGSKQSGLFHEPVAPEATPTEQIGSKSARNPENTPGMFPKIPPRKGAVALPDVHAIAKKTVAVARAIGDALGIDAVPNSERAGVGDEMVAHAVAHESVPHQVNFLLSKVFPDDYHDTKKMSKTMGIIVKDNVLQGYDDFLKRSVQADKAGDTAAAKRFENAAADVAQAHDLDKYDTDVQKAMADPQTKANIDRWKEHVNPYLDQLYNEIKGVDPNTPREGRGRHTGARINLLATDEKTGLPLDTFGDPMEPQKTRPKGDILTGNTRNPNARKDRFDRAASFTGDYSVDPELTLTEALGRRYNEVTKLRLYDVMQKKGVAVIPEEGQRPPRELNGIKTIAQGIKVPETDPQTGKTRQVEKTMWVQGNLQRELRAVLNTDLRPPNHPIAKLATAVQLASPVDFVAHSRNLLTVVTNAPGGKSAWADVLRKFPGIGSADALARIGSVAKEVAADTPEIRAEIARMSQQGLIRPEYPASGLQAITKTGTFIHKLDTATRIVMNRFFDNLVERGDAKDTPANRRNFINQAGQYNRRMMGTMMRTFKDMGLSPFIVAGRTFNRQGRRALFGTPGVEAPTAARAAKLRAIQLLGPALTLGAVPMMLNAISTGKPMGRPGTPLGAWDTGKDDENGNHRVIDLAHISGMRRGLRSTGLNAAIEGARQGKDANTITGNAVSDTLQTAAHPWIGPGLGFGYAALTGRRLDLRGTMNAQVVKEGGGKQIVENARAASEAQNPMLYALARPTLKKMGIDKEPDQDTGWAGEAGREGLGKVLLSAAGVKSVREPSSAALDLARKLSFRGEGFTAEEAETFENKKDILRQIREQPQDARKIVFQAVKGKQLTSGQGNMLLKKQKMTPLQWSVRSLTPKQAMDVWGKANPDEQKEIVRELRLKVIRAKIGPQDRRDYLSRLRAGQ